MKSAVARLKSDLGLVANLHPDVEAKWEPVPVEVGVGAPLKVTSEVPKGNCMQKKGPLRKKSSWIKALVSCEQLVAIIATMAQVHVGAASGCI